MPRKSDNYGLIYVLGVWGLLCGLLALHAGKPFFYGFFIGTAPVVFIAVSCALTMLGLAWAWQKCTGEEPGAGFGMASILAYVLVVSPLLICGLRALGVPIRW